MYGVKELNHFQVKSVSENQIYKIILDNKSFLQFHFDRKIP